MTIAVVVVVALAGFWLFLFVLKRVLRMAIRLAILGALLLALLAGGVAWWWYGPAGDAPSGSAPARNSRNAR